MADESEEITRLAAENASLRSEVREWLCGACATIYPGPPATGVMCVICPKCEGLTGPRLSIENASLLESLKEARDGLHHAETRLVEMCARWTDAQAQIDSARYVVEKARDCERAEQRARATEKALTELLRLYDWRFKLAEREKDPSNCYQAFRTETLRLLRQYCEEKKVAWEAARAALQEAAKGRAAADGGKVNGREESGGGCAAYRLLFRKTP